MIKLQIRRKTTKVWQHFITDGENFIFSKCYCKTNGDNFRIVEDGGTAKNEYTFDEIEVYDDVNSGIAETFTSSLELMERLSTLNYVGFNNGGTVVIADIISTDSSNAIVEGTDGKLFVSSSESTPTLQEVTDIGNNTTNEIIAGNFVSAGSGNFGGIILNDGDLSQVASIVSLATPLIPRDYVLPDEDGTIATREWVVSNIYEILKLGVTTNPTPSDGDVWLESNTNTGLKIRINGVTKTITLT